MIQVEPIPAFRDNYIWALHDRQAVVFVDPGDAAPILAWLGQRRLKPAAILVTHRHSDHIGGVPELVRAYPMPVYGPEEALPVVDHLLSGGESLTLPGIEIEMRVIAVPGHTLGHLAYHGQGMLFCGDTLFSCGCGRVFEGTPAMMHASLDRLAGLQDDTRVYCAHEYTLANLAFARHVEPDNPHLLVWQAEATRLRQAGKPTLPTRLADERRHNPFLRCADPVFRKQLEESFSEALPYPVSAFALLREVKNTF
jgi:hydroxyacylglutathione hydrolase